MAYFKYFVSFFPKDYEQAREYINVIEGVGYVTRRDWGEYSLQNDIITTYPHGFSQVVRKGLEHEPYIFHGENEWEYEAAKAIASIHQDNEYHDGEWVIFDGPDTKLDSNVSSKFYTIGNLYQLGGKYYHENNNNQLFYTREDNEGEANGSMNYKFHKASPEEITAFFKQKYTDMENKEIIGYRLLKDTPTLKAGIEFKFKKDKKEYAYKTDGDEFTYWYTQQEIDNADGWFEPIYEEMEVVETLSLGSRNVLIMMTSNKRITTTRSSTPIKIEKLVELLDHIDAMNNIEISEWGPYIAKDVRWIRIGCENENNLFSYNEIQQVINIYNKLNP